MYSGLGAAAGWGGRVNRDCVATSKAAASSACAQLRAVLLETRRPVSPRADGFDEKYEVLPRWRRQSWEEGVGMQSLSFTLIFCRFKKF